ncbi:MAG: PstS family phosphate ABC transporter substrate-binding protein [candidate division FCPU426 bacterium]
MKKTMLVAGVLAACVALAGSGMAVQTVQVKGSDTLVHLSSAWAEKFMQANPGMEVAVTGGGSGTGISALINGTTDLANASREMKASEKATIEGQGLKVQEYTVALDGIAVIVNPSNPLASLTMEQVKQLYTGQISKWAGVGGGEGKVLLYTRDSSSGTFAFFQEHVLKMKDYSVKSRRLASNSAIVQGVAEDLNAIGYVGLGYVQEAGNKVKVLKISKDASSPAILPSVPTVKDNSYPISRGLFVYAKGEPQGAVKAFVDFMLSAAGQTIVEEMGFVSK